MARGAAVAAAARGWIGTPYHHQASRRGAGCDCLGLVRGVWREVIGPEPVAVPAYSGDWGEVGAREVLLEALARALVPVGPEAAGPGAVLVFRMARAALAKHAGILVAPGRIVHARERLGVIEEPLTEAWLRRVAGIFVYPEGC